MLATPPGRPLMSPNRLVRNAAILLLAVPTLGLAQTAAPQPDANALLARTGAAYRAMKTFSAKATVQVAMDSPSAPPAFEMEITVMADATGRMRMSGSSPTGMGMLMVFDGKTDWVYLPQLNKYAQMPAGESSAGGNPLLGAGSGRQNYLQQYGKIGVNVKEASVLRSETLEVAGAAVPCWVVSVTYSPESSPSASSSKLGTPKVTSERAKTLWIGQKDYLVYREDSSMAMTMPEASTPSEVHSSLRFDSIAVDQAVPADSFTFTPPAGATELDLSGVAPKTPPAH